MIVKIGNVVLSEITSEYTGESKSKSREEKSSVRFVSVKNNFRLWWNKENTIKKFDGVEGSKVSSSKSKTITESAESILKNKVFGEETGKER